MRFRSVGVSVGTKKIDNSFVISDNYHMEKIGLDAFGGHCYFVDGPENVPDIAQPASRITLLDTHVKRILKSYRFLTQDRFKDKSFIFTLITTRGYFWQIFEQLIQSQELKYASVIELALTNQSAIVSFGPSLPKDGEISTFLSGLRFRETIPEAHSSGMEEACNTCAELENKLFDVLQIIPAAIPQRARPKTKEDSAELIDSENESLQTSISAMKQEIEELQKSNTGLMAKYGALANSRLGKVTLKYWAWRKGASNEQNS